MRPPILASGVMPDLFLRTLAQGFEAFVPVAVWLAWLRRSGQLTHRAAILRGILAAGVGTPGAIRRLLHSGKALGGPGPVGIAAAGGALACTISAWRTRLGSDQPRDLRWRTAVAMAVALVMLRQTIVIGAVLGVAAFQVRSIEAAEAVIGAVMLSMAAAAAWTVIARWFPAGSILVATRACATVFVAQVALCAFHRSAEAHFLPYADSLDAATESYGPESVFGRAVSLLLPVVALAAAVSASIVERCRRAPMRTRLRQAAVPLAGVVLIGGTAVVAARALDAVLARGDTATGP
jgi:hypothetical protein